MIKIASPISHLFDDPKNAREIVTHSDSLECRDESLEAEFPGQELFHCDIQPIHELRNGDFRYLERIANLKPDLKLVSFHAASSCSNPFIKDAVFQPGGVQYSREAMLKNARRNIRIIKGIFGAMVGIAIENNNYHPTSAYRFVTGADFIREIVWDNEILFLFDMAHGRITAHNSQWDYEDYKKALPLDRTVQIHVCRHFIDEQGCARDAHEIPGERQWKEVEDFISGNQTIEYLTIEYYRKTSKLIDSLKRAKETINAVSGKAF